MIKIAIYGLSGAGKSTTTKLIQDYFKEKGMNAAVVKLAYPLYEIQKKFYDTAGKAIDFYDQDQVLLEVIATHLRRISETSLADNFMRRLKECTSEVILNDDIRDYKIDYPALKKEGFIFIRITCNEEIRVKRLLSRNDLSVNLKSATTNDLDKFEADWFIDTSTSDIDILRIRVYEILEQIRIKE